MAISAADLLEDCVVMGGAGNRRHGSGGEIPIVEQLTRARSLLAARPAHTKEESR